MFNLYNHIESLALEHGFKSIQELCNEAGIWASVLSNLNNGKVTSISLRTAQKLATALGVSVDTVYGRDKAAPPEVSDGDLKAAFFGGEQDLSPDESDALWQETKDYIEFRKKQMKKK